MRCHQNQGPGLGQFVVSGTIKADDGSPYNKGGFVEIGKGKGAWGEPDPLKKLKDFRLAYRVPVDEFGNFYVSSVEELDFSKSSYQARITDRQGKVLSAMAPQKVGACNTCHNGSFSLILPREGSR